MITSSLNFSQLDPRTFKLLLEEKEGTLIDIRTPAEFADNHISPAMNIDFYASDFEQQLELLDKESPCFIYCQTGNRTQQVLEIMRSLDFKEVYDLKGGILAWEIAGF